MLEKKIPLFYVSFLQRGQKIQNIGDYLSRFLVEKISGEEVTQVTMESKVSCYSAIGSILGSVTRDDCIVWGSGLVSPDVPLRSRPKILALRGPMSYLESKDKISSLPAFGDPALLLPLVVQKPKIEKYYDVGLVPNHIDIPHVLKFKKSKNSQKSVNFINVLTDDVENFVKEICSCRLILSSSLHGLIIAHAYGIPALWIKLSDQIIGSGFKFHDYFASVSIPTHDAIDLTSEEFILLEDVLDESVKKNAYKHLINFDPVPLINTCPFALRNKKAEMVNKFISIQSEVKWP
jgi:pyruvyltransferase